MSDDIGSAVSFGAGIGIVGTILVFIVGFSIYDIGFTQGAREVCTTLGMALDTVSKTSYTCKLP